MKPWQYSVLSLSFLSFFMVLSFQNCGDVGGVSPSALSDASDDDDYDDSLGNSSELAIGINYASFSSSKVFISGVCQRGLYYDNRIEWKVIGVGYSYTQTSTSSTEGICNANAFSIEVSPTAAFVDTNEHIVYVKQIGIDNGKRYTNAAAYSEYRLGRQLIKPGDTAYKSYSSLAGSSANSYVNLADALSPDYYGYGGLELGFHLNFSSIPETQAAILTVSDYPYSEYLNASAQFFSLYAVKSGNDIFFTAVTGILGLRADKTLKVAASKILVNTNYRAVVTITTRPDRTNYADFYLYDTSSTEILSIGLPVPIHPSFALNGIQLISGDPIFNVTSFSGSLNNIKARACAYTTSTCPNKANVK